MVETKGIVSKQHCFVPSFAFRTGMLCVSCWSCHLSLLRVSKYYISKLCVVVELCDWNSIHIFGGVNIARSLESGRSWHIVG